MPVKKLVVSPEVLQLLKSGNFEPTAKVYKPKETLVTIPAGSWEHESRVITPKSGGPAFTMELAKFSVGKDQFERPFASGEEIDEANEIKIANYVAERDYQPSSGNKIAKGTVKQFAANA